MNSPLSVISLFINHNPLKNLTVTSNNDQIYCDYPGKDGLLFHIPLQFGIK